MEIEFFGANTVRVSYKKTVFVVDDNLDSLGKKAVTKSGDISLQTDVSIPVAKGGRLLLDAPGEFEVGDVSVTAVAARGHRDEEGKTSATIFKLHSGDSSVVVLGHIHPDISGDQLETIGDSDVLVIPVGGHGFTLDPVGALDIIKKLQPSVVIPTYYQMPGIKTEVPQLSLDEAVQQLALQAEDPVKSFKIKPADFVADQTKLVIVQS